MKKDAPYGFYGAGAISRVSWGGCVDRPGFAYSIIESYTGLIKVGVSSNPLRRLRQVANDFKWQFRAKQVDCRLLALLKTDSMRDVERFLHWFMRHRHVAHEWFNVKESDCVFIFNNLNVVKIAFQSLFPPDFSFTKFRAGRLQ